MELQGQHCARSHPLIFTEEIYGREIRCAGCREPVLGPSYRCEDGCDFFLDKSCAEQPRQIKHPFHRKHPLNLVATIGRNTCDLCLQSCGDFFYRCDSCDFDLHVKCATAPPCLAEPEVHKHQFFHLLKLISFTCDACGMQGDRFPCLCTICHVMVHEDCASLDRTITIIRHIHPLTHVYFLQENDYVKSCCGLCEKEVNTEHGAYCCQQACKFIAHVNCARENIPWECGAARSNEEQVPNITLLDESLGSIRLGDEEKELGAEIKHFSHDHNLILSVRDEAKEVCLRCDGCMLPILDPFYRCSLCNFALHKTCVELPRSKQIPIHRHLLALLPNSDSRLGMFCEACNQTFHGFTYHCQECNWNVDVRCAALLNNQGSLIHEGHEHPFFLGRTFKQCTACGHVNFFVFSCVRCDFNLCFKCATLPHIVRYKSYEHPLILTYRSIDDGSNEYICDICETTRDPNHWFYYHCGNGDFYAHPECAFGKYPYMKLGRTYTCNETHSHPLTLVQMIKKRPSCRSCGNPCNNLALECADCDFIIHLYDPCNKDFANT